MHAADWLPTVAYLAGIPTPLKTGRPLDGFNQWHAIAHGAQSPRRSVVHNMPTAGYSGAVRLGHMKLLFSGMQTVATGVRSSRYPPAGFVPATPDVFPQGVNATVGGGSLSTTTTVWLFNVSSDPQEMTNLAADPAWTRELSRVIHFYEEYQKTAVEDLSLAHPGPDPAANPFLREDDAWGPYVGSKLCMVG
jgi:arylsulfatase A-like enzyme